MKKPSLKVLMEPIKEAFPNAVRKEINQDYPPGYKQGLVIYLSRTKWIYITHPYENYNVSTMEKHITVGNENFNTPEEVIQFLNTFF